MFGFDFRLLSPRKTTQKTQNMKIKLFFIKSPYLSLERRTPNCFAFGVETKMNPGQKKNSEVKKNMRYGEVAFRSYGTELCGET